MNRIEDAAKAYSDVTKCRCQTSSCGQVDEQRKTGQLNYCRSYPKAQLCNRRQARESGSWHFRLGKLSLSHLVEEHLFAYASNLTGYVKMDESGSSAIFRMVPKVITSVDALCYTTQAW